MLSLIKILKFRVEVPKLDPRTNLNKSQLDKRQRHFDAGNLRRRSSKEHTSGKEEFPYR